jgi:hypothetical protein
MKMKTKVHRIDPEAKKLADKLRGDMGYGQHYAYLLKWYMNDRTGKHAGVKAPIAPVNGGNGSTRTSGSNITAVDDHVKESLKEVLESLKHLDRRIDRVSVQQKTVRPQSKATQPQTQTQASEQVTADKPKIKVDRAQRLGKIFTRLVDKRRHSKA